MKSRILTIILLTIQTFSYSQGNILVEPSQRLYDSLSNTKQAFWIYEVSNIAGNFSIDTCNLNYYVSLAFVEPNRVLQTNFCGTSELGNKKPEIFEFFRTKKSTMARDSIKLDYITFHDTERKLVYYHKNKLIRFYFSESDLADDNKYVAENAELTSVRFTQMMDKLIMKISR